MAGTMMRTSLALALAAVALNVYAQQHPNIERGLLPDKSYEVTDVDAVNLFNGVLNVSIPIGGRYQVNGNLSYQFVLTYATNGWETGEHYVTEQLEEPPYILEHRYNWTFPARRMNAGFGWILTLGELLFPEAGAIRRRYLSSDGGQHEFFDTLHSNNPSEQPHSDSTLLSVGYTRDGTYLRLRRYANRFELDFPNGDVHTFSLAGKITSIKDAHGNEVTITYSTRPAGHPYAGSSVWTITDPHRSHEIYFRPGASYEEFDHESVVAHEIVDYVKLAAFDGTHAEYHFDYANHSGTTPPSTSICRWNQTTEPDIALFTQATLLQAVRLPGNEALQYEMTYGRGGAPNCYYTPETQYSGVPEGNMGTLQLPTGAVIRYTYNRRELTTISWADGSEVGERKITDASGNAVYDWTVYTTERYATGLGEPAQRRIIQKKDRTGAVLTESRHYFTTCSSTACVNAAEYGLPLTRVDMPSAGPFLSTEEMVPRTDGFATEVLRSTYVIYEADGNLAGTTSTVGSRLNARVRYTKTAYEDGTYVDATLSNFDGLGQYRQTVLGGDNPNGSNDRTSFTNYNPTRGVFNVTANGSYSGTFTMPPVSGKWILSTYDKQQVTEGSETSTVETCFDANGFLTGKRTYAAFGTSPARQTTDLLAIFTPDTNGNLSLEQYLGGDDALGVGAPTTSTCLTSSANENYRIDHKYQFGSRKASYFVNASDQPMSHFIVDHDIDQNTGFVKLRRAASTPGANGVSLGDGLKTTLGYDALGRLVSETPVLEGTASTTNNRGAARTVEFFDNSTRVEISEKTVDGATVLRTRTLNLDPLGRMIKETRSLPAGVSAWRTWEYDGLGRITALSAWGNQTPAVMTRYQYDSLGRLQRQIAADGSIATFGYTGVRESTQTSSVATGPSQATDATRTFAYDRHGRLRRVTEPNGVVTRYAYDFGDRLIEVCGDEDAQENCEQTRTFTYDNRGYLTSEQVPELGTSGNGTASYSYDARGNPIRKIVGASGGPFDVAMAYDRAGRLTRVYETKLTNGVQRDLKLFTYGTANSGTNYSKGRITRAVRHNWLTSVGFNVQIIEDYLYEGREGRVSSRTTFDSECAGDAAACNALGAGTEKRQFTQSFSYNELGAVTSLEQPTCELAPCSEENISSRTVTNQYDNGWLTGVTWTSAPRAATIAYHDNGMVSRVTHANLVKDEILLDASRVPRPFELKTSNVRDAASCTVPTFVTHPQSQTIASGGTAVLTAKAEGQDGSTITYQWYRGTYPDRTSPQGAGTLLSGGVSQFTTSTLTAATSYWAEASNSCSASTGTASRTATIAVCTAPAIAVAAQPQSRSITRSQIARLDVTASGSEPLSYQWYTVSGTTATAIDGAVFAFIDVGPTTTTKYRLKVTNACGFVNSADATITVHAPPTVPTGVTVTTTNTVNTVTWSASTSGAGIHRYEVYRRNGPVLWVIMPNPLVATVGPTGITANTAYLYRVRAVDVNGIASPWSSYDLATTTAFSDDPIAIGVTEVGGVHIAQIRQAIDALRAEASLAAGWTTYAAVTGEIFASQITQMRSRLNEARAALGVPTLVFTDPSLTIGATVRAAHVQELRNGTK